VEITDRRLLNETVTTDSDVVVRVDLTNFDPARGRITLNLTADRTLVAQRTVTVGVDGRRTVDVRATLDGPGRYEIRLNGVSVGTVTVTTATDSPTDTVSGTDETPSATVAPTPESPDPTATGGETSGDGEVGTTDSARTGTGTTTPAVGPRQPSGTDIVVAAGMTLMLLYGVGVAVYVLREHPPSGLG